MNGGFVQVNTSDATLGNANNDIYLNGGGLTINNFAWGPAATRTITLQAGGGTLNITGNTTTFANAGQLTGSGRLIKGNTGTLVVSAANAGLSGAIYLTGGLTDLNAAGGLGSGNVNVFNQTTLRTNLASFGTQNFYLQAGGAIEGSNAALATLTRGSNLHASNGAIIVEQAAGGNAGVGSLGTAADLYFGVGGSAAIASESVTIGSGTPWRGLSTGRNGFAQFGATTAQISAGTITVNSDFDLQAPLTWLVLGTSATSFEFSGTSSYIATIQPGNGSAVGGTVMLDMNNPTFSGISKFVVKPGAVLWPAGAQSLGNKTVDVEVGGIIGHTGNAQGTVDSNSFGTSTINLAGINQVNIRGTGGTSHGGTFELDSALPNQFNMNRDSNATSGALTISNLTINANNAGASITSGNNRTLGISGTITANNHNFTLAPQGGTHAIAATWAASNGTFTKGDGGQISITGNASAYTGNVVVRGGTLLLNSTWANNFGGAGGSNTYRIMALTDAQTRFQGYSILVLNSDNDIGGRIAVSSDGFLGLNLNISTLTGVNGSSVFIAASGGARQLTSTTLAAGAGSTYRLGGLGQSLNLDAAATTTGVLTGANNVIIGAPRNPTSGTGSWSGGSVLLLDSNDYTGTTLVNPQSTLTLGAANAIGNGASLGAIDVYGTMIISGATGTMGAAATTINLRRGGTLTIDNSAANLANRVADGTAINLAGASLGYSAFSGATNTETVGAIALQAGFNTITITRPNVVSTLPQLTLTSLSRSAGAQLNIVPATSGSLGSTTQLFATGYTVGIAPGVYSNNTDFAEYNATNGFQALTGTRPTLAAAIAGDNVVSVGADSLGASLAVNSYRITGAATVNLNGNTLTTTNLMHTGGTAVTISNGDITSSTAELIFNGTSSNTTISANITGTTGLVARHNGSLILSGTNNSFSGTSYLNGGTVEVRNALTGNPNIEINPGATLALRNDASTTFLTGAPSPSKVLPLPLQQLTLTVSAPPARATNCGSTVLQ